ncbi:MAG: diguanylate cyclase, partial [Wenzhouxiangella sp.]
EQGRVWAGTSDGLVRIEDGETMRFGPETGLPSGPVFSLLPARDGNMFVGTESGLYAGSEESFDSYSAALSGEAVSALLMDEEGVLWAGTINSGLARIRNGEVEWLGTDDGLPNNRVLSLHLDTEGSLWVGTNGGLFRLRSAPFVTIGRESGLAGNYVRALLPHSDGSLWIGTSEGVSRKRNGRVEPVRLDGEPFELSTLSLAERANGDVAIGTHADGVLIWRDGRLVRQIQRSDGLPANDIRMMHEDRRGRLWIATAGGLSRVTGDRIDSFGLDDGLPGDFVIALHEDDDGTIWVGTGVGLARVENDTIEAISLYDLDETMYVYGFNESEDGDAMWLTTDRGLVHYPLDGREPSIVGRAAGMPIDKFFHLVDDRSGSFWLTSNRGILRLDKDDARAVVQDRLDTIDFELYTEGDGLRSAQANGGAGPAAAYHDGRVWVATAAGLASVSPDHLTRYEETELPVSIENFNVDGRDYDWDEPVELPPGVGRVTLSYAGLGFVMPERIRYRTLLEGFDSEWVSRNTQNVAEYTNLPPGDYLFRVTASYPYGAWNGEEARVAFTIAPLVWQRVEFWILAAVLFGGMMIMLIRWRMRRLEARAADLRAQVEEKTRELRRQAAEFERQARIDQLTGLANRRAFDEWLGREFRRTRDQGQVLSLAIADLDHFKQINDDFTHLIGDRVMQLVARVLRDHIRQGDQAARWGGEEFTLTFHDSNAEDAARICERIRRAIAETDFDDIAPGLKITASFGISDSEQAGNYESLLRQADQALYRAKKEGRNRVIVHDSSTKSGESVS